MTTETPLKKSYSDKRLDRACQYVSDMWFPANPAVISRLQATISSNDCELDVDFLFGEIQGDYSLYMFCLKELHRLLKEDGVETPEYTTPLELFRFAGLDRLKAILDLSDRQVSQHSFHQMSSAQQRRLQDSLVSASTVQVLAKHQNLDSSLGYSSALLRQLGLTLIAWNYPSVYEKVLSTLDEKTSLDLAISQTLGFSPAVLAVAIVHKWGLSAEMCAALDFNPDQAEEVEEMLEVEAVGSMLAGLCRIGETLARANNPRDYPSAKKDWVKAQNEIKKRLGADGITLIQQAVTENCQQYTISSPNFFKPGSILDPESHLFEHLQGTLLAGNPFVQECNRLIRERMIALYANIARGVSSEEAVWYLVNQIIPPSGFSGGAVFTIEPASNFLVPQLKILEIETRKMAAVECTGHTKGSDQVFLAYHCEAPIIHENIAVGEVSYACVAGLFGFTQRIGVLFLEIPQLVFNEQNEMHMSHFKAFAQALNDCLELGNRKPGNV